MEDHFISCARIRFLFFKVQSIIRKTKRKIVAFQNLDIELLTEKEGKQVEHLWIQGKVNNKVIFFLQRVFVDFLREGGGGGGQEPWAREFSLCRAGSRKRRQVTGSLFMSPAETRGGQSVETRSGRHLRFSFPLSRNLMRWIFLRKFTK